MTERNLSIKDELDDILSLVITMEACLIQGNLSGIELGFRTIEEKIKRVRDAHVLPYIGRANTEKTNVVG